MGTLRDFPTLAMLLASLKSVRLSSSLTRTFSTSTPVQKVHSKPTNEMRWHEINFSHFPVYNKRGTKQFKREQYGKKGPKYPDLPIHTYGTRTTGINHAGYFEPIPEMIPELIVPDLTDFQLKPYVSYATKEVYQEELTSKDLFNVLYGRKIIKDFKEGKLDEDGNSLSPSELEKITSEEALERAQATGADVFLGGDPEDKNWNL